MESGTIYRRQRGVETLKKSWARYNPQPKDEWMYKVGKVYGKINGGSPNGDYVSAREVIRKIIDSTFVPLAERVEKKGGIQ